MTAARFTHLLATVRMRAVSSTRAHNAGVFVEGITPAELSQLITLAGVQLGEINKGSQLNPAWLEAGPAADMHLQFHREALLEHLL